MRHHRALAGSIATTVCAALALGATSSATAEPPGSPSVSDPIVSGLVGPLQLEVGPHRYLVSQSFAGLLTRVGRDGSTRVLVAAQPSVEDGTAEISGIATRGRWIAYTETQSGPGDSPEAPAPIIGARLKLRAPNGTTTTLANLMRFERRHNPDAKRTYGFLDLDASCAAQVPAEVGGGEPTSGLVDSHPYAVARAPQGGWYVADAGGNTVLHVSKSGRVHVAYVARAIRAKVTQQFVDALDLPDCTLGSTYAFEGVPTDVEVTRRGHLVVSLLPGGPEDPSLGARGRVVHVVPFRHRSWTLARGLAGATNVAIGRRGTVYVAELFGEKISVIRDNRPRTLVELPQPGAVEYARGSLFVTTNVFGDGSIVRVKLGG